MRAGTILIPVSLLFALTACGGENNSRTYYGSLPGGPPGHGGNPNPPGVTPPPNPAGPPGATPVPTPLPPGVTPPPNPAGPPGATPAPTPVPPGATPVPTPVPPTPVPAPNSVVLNPSSLAFTAAGPSYAQNVAISEGNYIGTWTTTNTCAGIATVSLVSSASFSVTPVAAGACNVVVSDSAGKSTTLPVSVTTTAVTVN